MDTAIIESPARLVDKNGSVIKYANTPPNLDPTFFFGMPRGGNVTTGDIDRHPYRHHPWVHACVWNIASKLSAIDHYLEFRGKRIKDTDDKWGVLNRLKHPNPYMGRSVFIQQIILNLLLPAQRVFDAGGQCFILPLMADAKNVKCDLMKGQAPDVLMVYNDDHVRPKKENADGGMMSLLGWEFYVSGKENLTRLHLSNEIIRIHLANPYDYLAGLSLYEPARLAILSDIKSDVYNTRVFDNNAIPAGILSSKNPVTKQQRQETQSAWNEEYGGSGNAGKIAILGNDLTYQQVSLGQKDMEWQATKQDAYRKILASYGQNKIAMGDYEQINRATIVEGRKMLWEDTYIPKDRLWLEAVNSQWINYLDPELYLRSDYSKIEALKVGRQVQVGIALGFKELGFSATAACQMADITISEDILDKYPELSETPVAPAAPMKPAPPVPPEDGEPTTSPVEGNGGVVSNRVRLSINKKYGNVKEVSFKLNVLDAYLQRVFIPGEKAMQKFFVKFFADQRNRMQDKVDAYFKGKEKAIQRAGDQFETNNIDGLAESFMLDKVGEDELLAGGIKPYVVEQMKRVKAQLNDLYGSGIKFDVTDEKIGEMMKARLADVKQINQTTEKIALDKIKSAIQSGVEDQLTIKDMAAKIKDAIGEGMEIRKNQSVTIARTEVGIVSGVANDDAMRDSGIEFKKWLTANDESVRDSHAEMDEQVVSMDDPFVTGAGNVLMHPCDPDGEADEIINCRCVEIAVINKNGDIYESDDDAAAA